MKTGVILQPGESMTFSMQLPDFTSKEGKCWNPECEHTLSWGTRGNGRPDGWAEDCPYCGWTATGAPTNPKWMKVRWPTRYGFELRELVHGKGTPISQPAPIAQPGLIGRLVGLLKKNVEAAVCKHDWVEVGETWWEGHGQGYAYYPKTICENVICDKCHALGVTRKENRYTMVGGGFTDVPRRWFWNDGDQLNIPIAKHPEWTSEEAGKALHRAHPRYRERGSSHGG